MNGDSFTEVTSESWGSRLGDAFKGVIFGVILFIAGFPVLFINEGNAVQNHRALKEGEGNTVVANADFVDPTNEGALVYICGEATTSETLQDPQFGVRAEALKLRRSVEIYQWEEHTSNKTKKKLGGGTETVKEYNYKTGWTSRHVDSSRFRYPDGHQNPGGMDFNNDSWQANEVTVGKYTLSPALIAKINNFSPLAVAELPAELAEGLQLYGGGFYQGANPATPAIGDERITFAVALPTEVSLISKQIGNTFEKYVAKSGKPVELLSIGSVPAATMYATAVRNNKILAWVLRGVGLLIMLIGLNMVFKPLSVLADVVPFLGSLVGVGTGIVAFLIAAPLAMVTISIAWLFYRPLVAVPLLAVAAVLAVVLVIKMQQAKPATPPSS